jgi:uncharacterized membrane-anchored protein
VAAGAIAALFAARHAPNFAVVEAMVAAAPVAALVVVLALTRRTAGSFPGSDARQRSVARPGPS